MLFLLRSNKFTSEIASWKNQQTSQEGKGNTSSDWWLKWSTIGTAFATLAIAGLGGFQWWAMHKQRLAMDAQAAYMKDGVTENKKSADAAVASADITHRIFIDSHQPKLTVRFMRFNQSAETSHDLALEGEFALHNVGGSDVILLKEYTEIFPGNPPSSRQSLSWKGG
jgi:hypothetical protein